MVALLRRVPFIGPSVAGEEPDAALVERAKRGETPAFETLYLRYLEEIGRFCLVRLRDQERARDATQMVFLRAFQGIGRYREQGAFRGWLYQIARSVLANEFRDERPSLPLEAAVHVPAWIRSTEEDALAELSRQELLDAVARLAPEQRQAIELRMVGLSGLEIAVAMGKSHEAVRSLVKRGIERLLSESVATGERRGRRGR